MTFAILLAAAAAVAAPAPQGAFPDDWQLKLPDGASTADFWCSFDRDGHSLHFKVDKSRQKGREDCSIVVPWQKCAPFAGTNRVYRLVCRQGRERPMGANAPTIILADVAGVECFPYRPLTVTAVGDRVVATYRFVEDGVAFKSWGLNPDGKFGRVMALSEILVPCERSGEVWIDSFGPADAADGAATCATFEPAASFREGFDRYCLNWDSQGRADYVDGRLRVAPSRHEAFLAYVPQGVLSRPFRGPQTIRLRTAGAHPAGQVTLELVHRDLDRPVKATVPWRDDGAEFRFDLSPSDWYHFARLTFRRDEGFGRLDPFEVLSLEAEARETPADAVRLDVDAGGPLPFTTDKGAVSLVFTNAAREPVAFTGALVLENYFGERIPVSVRRTLEGRGQARVPVDLGAAKRPLGIWRVAGTLASGDAQADVETRFAVLNENPRTPRLGRDAFKMGINHHMARFADEPLRRLTLDALSACGAKLVRAEGFSAASCSPARGVYDFAQADVFMRELKARGLSLNADVWPNSDWMVTKEQLKLGYPGWTRVRTEKGVMGAFARELARHFGADIEFLETSNEADLWPEGAMTVAECVDYQKEVYEAVKSACTDIKVLPSAWAAADSSSVLVTRKGYQEGVMAGAKGLYDVHPVHLHVEFGLYAQELSDFFAMRRKLGIENVPWYPNESAVTSVNGAEDGVAQDVWKKILYSWAHGAVSYIWYNLKATGWCPTDPEQGYGLVTADFHPRAGFAAFSALAHVAAGLDFRGIVQEGQGRFLYRFEGEKGGTRRIVFAGWDGFTDPPFPIRVATDAARATVYDLMGNGRPAETCAGGFTFPISSVPGALVLEGATRAEANAK